MHLLTRLQTYPSVATRRGVLILQYHENPCSFQIKSNTLTMRYKMVSYFFFKQIYSTNQNAYNLNSNFHITHVSFLIVCKPNQRPTHIFAKCEIPTGKLGMFLPFKFVWVN